MFGFFPELGKIHFLFVFLEDKNKDVITRLFFFK
jgi:hypothetical protein